MNTTIKTTKILQHFELIKKMDTELLNYRILKGKIPNPYNCSICFDDTSLLILKENLKIPNINSSPATLDEILHTLKKLPNNSLFISSCKINNHLICSDCFKRLCQGAITARQGRASCICIDNFTGEECGVSYKDSIVKSVLTTQEYNNYKQMVKISPHKTKIFFECPVCNDTHNVFKKDIKSNKKGSFIIGCADEYTLSLEKHTNGRKTYFCYDCKSIKNSLNDDNFFDGFCISCSRSDEENIPHFTNRYFSGFKSNEELTLETCYKEIKETILMPEFNYIKCFQCDTKLEKTEKCNTVTHCGIERCYSCGRSGTPDRPFLEDHWSEEGNQGCPRWDNAPYWNKVADCDFQCCEDVCYSYILGKCDTEIHQKGIKNMEETRRLAFVYHQLLSLKSKLRKEVIDKMKEDEEIKNHKITKEMSNETLWEYIKENTFNTGIRKDYIILGKDTF